MKNTTTMINTDCIAEDNFGASPIFIFCMTGCPFWAFAANVAANTRVARSNNDVFILVFCFVDKCCLCVILFLNMLATGGGEVVKQRECP